MITIGWDRKLDPDLYDLYARSLPQKGWPGMKSKEEKKYIKAIKSERKQQESPQSDGGTVKEQRKEEKDV